MTQASVSSWLDRPVDLSVDHILGDPQAPITLVEYGSYACPHCRAANERIAEVRDQFGARLRYVFRHRPLTGNELARRAAELAERAPDAASFWDAHVKLMTRSAQLTEEDLDVVAKSLGLEREDPQAAQKSAARARQRVLADEASARASNVMFTPTFFINNRRYDGPWDENSLADALIGTLGYRVRTATLDFVSWGPSAGMLLLAATIVAVLLANVAGLGFEAFWQRSVGLTVGSSDFAMPLQHWVNDGLLTVFFLVVGLEIKREFTVGRLASRRSAALPIAAAIGGMIAPVVLYSLVIPAGPWAHAWGVPMATDTAFAIALLVMMGARVPIELRIFLTAAAIVDDIGAIMVVAAFYSSKLHLGYLAAAAAITVTLAVLNRSHVYRLSPYMLLGAALWACVLAGGLHATLAGVILALFIPTRPPPNLGALMTQATAILASDSRQGEALRHGPSLPTLRALDAIHDRIESPAARLLRQAGARSSYVVLPIFALANAGVALSSEVLHGRESLMLAIVAGLVIGKPLGMLCACALAVWLKVAVKPSAYSWRQLAGAGALAGIGFTISLFIAGEALPLPADFATAKIAVFAASLLSAVVGLMVLWRTAKERETATQAEPTGFPDEAAGRTPV